MNRFTLAALSGVMGGLIGIWLCNADHRGTIRADDGEARQPGIDAQLQSDVQILKDKAPDQAHAMMSVAYDFSNMWFAAKAENWPLAEFYWNETRSHLRWAVRIIPIRKNLQGQEVKLEDILQSIENSPLKQLNAAIAERDTQKFVAAYKFTLEGCYSCHKAADKPYLRPHIPDRPAEPAINFDPAATWPQ